MRERRNKIAENVRVITRSIRKRRSIKREKMNKKGQRKRIVV